MAKIARKPRHWLFKSEPDAFSIDDLAARGRAPWDGVRNYTARNLLRDEVGVGDLILFYHSSTEPPGVVGVARVASPPRPDETAFDPEHAGHDPKSSKDAPRWFLVDVEFVEKTPKMVTLAELKADPKLREMLVVQRGQRLSVQPVDARHFAHVAALAGAACAAATPGRGRARRSAASA